jgi:hypothetical protein
VLLSTAGGCTTRAPAPGAPDRTPTVETLPVQALAGARVARESPLAIEVRMASAADLRDATWTSEAETMGLLVALTIGVGATGGVLAAPILAVYAAFGATWLPAALSVEGWKHATVRDALAQVDLPARTLEALRRTWPLAPAPSVDAGTARLEIVIPAYGFVAGEHGEACFFLDARYALERPGAPPHEDWVALEPLRRSADAPPAYCAQVRRFSEHGGALVRHTAEEAAEILAALVAHRLGPPP